MNLKYILLSAFAGTALLLGNAFSEDVNPSKSQENDGLATISIKQSSKTPRKLKPEVGRAIYSLETEVEEEPLATFSIKKTIKKEVQKNKPNLPKAKQPAIAQSPPVKSSTKSDAAVVENPFDKLSSRWQPKLIAASILEQTERPSFATLEGKAKQIIQQPVLSEKKPASNGFENLFPEMSESDADLIASGGQPKAKHNVQQVANNPFRPKNHLIGYQPGKTNNSIFNSLFKNEPMKFAMAQPPALLSKKKPTVKDATFARRMNELKTPVNGIQLVSASKEVKEPKNYAEELQREMIPVHLTGIPWTAYCSNRYPVYFTHNPLYYEDLNLERCGRGWSVLQPAISTGRFFTHTLLLPYSIVRNCPSSLVQSPGDCPSCYKFPHKH